MKLDGAKTERHADGIDQISSLSPETSTACIFFCLCNALQ